MRYAKCIVVVFIALIPALAAAQLAVGNQVTAQVPFTFVVADKVMPLGSFVIQRAGTIDQALVVQSPGAKTTAFAIVSPADATKPAGAYSLVFHKYGRRYFLAGLRVEGSRTLYSFKAGRWEQELLAQNSTSKDVILLASLK